MTFREAIERRPLVFDGAMGTQIQGHQLKAPEFGGKDGANDLLTLTRPDLIEDIHARYLAVGCDAVETNTFGSSRLKLDEYGLGHRTYEVNFKAAIIARRAAERFSTPDRPRFVAGSIGPTGMLPSSSDPALGNITADALELPVGDNTAAGAIVAFGIRNVASLAAALPGIYQAMVAQDFYDRAALCAHMAETPGSRIGKLHTALLISDQDRIRHLLEHGSQPRTLSFKGRELEIKALAQRNHGVGEIFQAGDIGTQRRNRRSAITGAVHSLGIIAQPAAQHGITVGQPNEGRRQDNQSQDIEPVHLGRKAPILRSGIPHPAQ